jgi:putative ABC transport system ATP-binding protein
MIVTENLTKIFRTDEIETNALYGINLRVREGEFVSIMGPSGCGKTTLLNILGMLDVPSSGKYSFFGEDVSLLSEKRRAKLRKGNIGFVFQNFNLIDEMTVFENVELPLIFLKFSSQERKKRVGEVLEQMQIIHKRKHFPAQLSGGQQQRVAVARAVVTRPRLVLADEPTGNLDSLQGEEVMNLLENLNKQGTTLVIVTHSQRDADYAQRILRLFDGQIINENIRMAHIKKEFGQP